MHDVDNARHYEHASYRTWARPGVVYYPFGILCTLCGLGTSVDSDHHKTVTFGKHIGLTFSELRSSHPRTVPLIPKGLLPFRFGGPTTTPEIAERRLHCLMHHRKRTPKRATATAGAALELKAVYWKTSFIRRGTTRGGGNTGSCIALFGTTPAVILYRKQPVLCQAL